MVSGPDHMGAPASFTARRPNASHLPTFELPPPPVKYPAYSHVSSAQSIPTSTTLTSVGNLLTPPSNGSTDGLSPSSLPSSASLSSHGAVQPFAPSAWPQTHSASSTPYGFQSAGTPQAFSSARGIFSPSLGQTIRSTSSPTASESLPPPPTYDSMAYSQSMPMPAPSLPSLPNHHSMHATMMHGQHTPGPAPVSQASPVSTHEGFSRPPPTPTGSYYSHASSTPHQGGFAYSTGPSPVVQSPMSAGGSLGKMSPVHQTGHIPSLQSHPQPQYPQHRPYSNYTMPVLSNINNPHGQLALVGGTVPPGMMPAFNSGHVASMSAMYGHPQPPNVQNDRPFRCDQCPQSFNRNHDLKRHKRIHLAVKPFPCGHCDKSFSRKDALKRHVLVKGCGKASATADVKEMSRSVSPRSEDHSPVITSVS